MTGNKGLGMSENKKNLIFLLSLSVILKIIIAIYAGNINSDGVIYISAAQEFASGHFKEGLAMYPMPLYSLLIAIVHIVIPDWVAAAQCISVTASVLVLIPLYFLIKRLFDHKAAFWGCLTFVLTPYANEYAVSVIRGPAFLLCFACATYYCIRAVESDNWVFFLIAAIFAWGSFFFRIEGIVLIPIFILFLIYLCLWKSKERAHFFKGAVIWIAFPLIFTGILFFTMGQETTSFNRMSEVTQNLKGFVNLQFLDNYHQIYNQLSILDELANHPSGKQNFTEIARHFMPFIYFFGLIYSLAQMLFVVFLIPLYLGFRHTLKRTHVFVLLLFWAYVLLVYYTLIERDFIQQRFLIAPAFLMHPWIGSGLAYLFALAKRHSRSRFMIGLFILAFIVTPVASQINQIGGSDNTLRLAGHWLANNNELHEARIMTTDFRVPFYAGKNMDSYIRFIFKLNNAVALEQAALESKRDLIIVRISAKKKDKIPTFKFYRKIKEINGKKDIVMFYCSPELCKILKSGEQLDKTNASTDF